MAKIGKVHDLGKEFNFEWRLEDFFSLKEDVDTVFDSPDFSFAGEKWFMSIYPNGDSEVNSFGYIGLYLVWKPSHSAVTVKSTFSLKTFDGEKKYEKEYSEAVYAKKRYTGWGYAKFLKRSTLLENKSELVPSDTLTIVLSVINFSRCNERTEELVNDLTNIFENEEFSDFTIKVKDEEFRLHKNILAVRNPYFNAMFKAEMKENKTGTLTIDDCEPEVFRTFVYFVYTGKLKALSHDNVCALYEVADKYQQDRLKAECLFFMKNEISVDSLCDFVELAVNHDEEELLKNATEFFCKKVKDIIKSVKWQNFMRDYPTQANELNIKAFDYYVK